MSDQLWSGAIGKTYADFLTAAEHRDFVRLVQARNVLAHQDGLVDADYVAKSGDRSRTTIRGPSPSPCRIRHRSEYAQLEAVRTVSSRRSVRPGPMRPQLRRPAPGPTVVRWRGVSLPMPVSATPPRGPARRRPGDGG